MTQIKFDRDDLLEIHRLVDAAFPARGVLLHQRKLFYGRPPEQPVDKWISLGKKVPLKDGLEIPSGLPLPVISAQTAVEGSVKAKDDDFSLEWIYEGLFHVVVREPDNERHARYLELLASLTENFLDTLLHYGSESVKAGEVGDGMRLFATACLAHPERTEPHFNLGVCCHELCVGALEKGAEEIGREWAEAAEKLFSNALAADPERHQARYFLGIYAQDRGEYEAAKAHWETFLEHAGSDNERTLVERLVAFNEDLINMYEKGVKAILQGRAEEGLKSLEPFAQKYPDRWRVHFYLGIAFRELERVGEAIRRFERTRELNPALPDADHELGVCLMMENNLPEARRAFESAYEKRPDDAAPLSNIALICLQTGDPIEAKRYIDRALEIAPDDEICKSVAERVRKAVGE